MIGENLDFEEIEIIKQPTTGQWIKALRILCGYEQSELAKLVGVKQAAISKWENNSNKPEAKYIEKLAEALHQDVSRILLICGWIEKK